MSSSFIDKLFLAALEMSPAEREQYLSKNCQSSLQYDEVRSLITAYEQAGNFLDEPALTAIKTAPDPLIGRALGEFHIREKIGEGGFGTVYRAEQITLMREAVVKVLHTNCRADSETTERFLREARLASKLEHPYTAHIYAFGAEPEGILWIAMEMVRGTPLDRLLRTQGAIPLERFVPLLERICEVVETAHEAGVVHRDLKPANVMVIARAGRLLPKLLDFGVAKGIGDNESGEGARGALGSAPYMPPEQWEYADAVDHRADIYALGVLSYEVITGARPFSFDSSGSLKQLYQAHCYDRLPPLGPQFPVSLYDVIARAMAKRPQERYASATEFATAFRNAAGFADFRAQLPQLDEQLRDLLVTSAPTPFAEMISELCAARNSFQAREQVFAIFRFLTRWLGILAIACRTKVGSGNATDTKKVNEMLRKLRGQGLTERQWLELTAELCRPFAGERDAYPIPELVSLFFEHGSTRARTDHFEPLLQAEKSVVNEKQAHESLSRTLPQLAQLLRAAAFLSDYPLVIRRGDRLESWMGSGGRRTAQPVTIYSSTLIEGKPTLVDANGSPLLLVWPLIQVCEPSAGSKEELFVLEGPGRRGAKLVVQPAGFERQDESVWDWFKEYLLSEVDSNQKLTVAERAPYPGLAAYTADEAELFFGREVEVESFVNRLRVNPLIALTGVSGAGKSSFIQAGVLPALPEGWHAITVRPGATPYKALEERLKKEGLISTGLAYDKDMLGELLRADNTGRVTVIIVDQFEELFTLCLDAGERQLYAECLARAARSSDDPVRVVIVLRDDFLVRAKQLTPFRDRLILEVLATPAPDDLLRILVQPAERAGYDFDDSELPREIVNALIDEPAALPLLAFTAARLWELRDRHFKKLLRKAYDGMGGVGGALARHAEELMAGFTKSEQRLVREAFRQLITSEGTRATLAQAELVEMLGGSRETESVVERLISARLLVASEGDQGAVRVEVVHETLLSAWPRLIEWQREDRDGARLRDQLRAAARQWEERGRVKGLLWRDEALAEYRLWRSRYAGSLTEKEEAFAAASINESTAGQRRRRALAIALFTILVAGLLILNWQRQQTEMAARIAEKNAESYRLEKLRSDEIAEEREREKQRAEEQRHIAVENEKLALRQTELARKSERQKESQLLEIYEERGRQELLVGNPLIASLYLSEAYQKGNRNRSLLFLLAQSMRTLDAQLYSLEGHQGDAMAAAYSADGKRIASTSGDGSVKIWDAATGKQVLNVNAHSDRALSVEFSSDGERLLTVGADSKIKIWQANNGKLINTLTAQRGVISASFNLAATHCVVTGEDRTLTLLDTAGTQVFSIKAHTDAIRSASFSPDGQKIVTAGRDRMVKIWDLSGTLVDSIDAHTEEINSAFFSPDGKRIVTASADNTAKIWDVVNGKLLLVLDGHKDVVNSARFSQDGTRVVTASDDYTVKLWNASNGNLLASYEGHLGKVFSASFNPKGKMVISSGSDGTVKVWNADSERLLTSVDIAKADAYFGDYAPEGARIITSGNDYIVKVSDVVSRRPLLSLVGHTYRLSSFEMSRNGKRIVTASEDDTVMVWDVASGRPLVTTKGGRAAFNSDASRFVATNNKKAEIWQVEPARKISELVDHDGTVTFSAFSPDNTRVITASRDKTARVWRVSDNRQLLSLRGHTAGLNWARFSPDGSLIVTASDDKTAKIWNALTGALVASLEGHKGKVRSAEFSPDGGRIVTASDDRTAKIFDVVTGKLLATLDDHMLRLSQAKFSPDGTQVITTSKDKSIKIWDVGLEKRKPEEVVERVKRLVPLKLVEGRLVSVSSMPKPRKS